MVELKRFLPRPNCSTSDTSESIQSREIWIKAVQRQQRVVRKNFHEVLKPVLQYLNQAFFLLISTPSLNYYFQNTSSCHLMNSKCQFSFFFLNVATQSQIVTADHSPLPRTNLVHSPSLHIEPPKHSYFITAEHSYDE